MFDKALELELKNLAEENQKSEYQANILFKKAEAYLTYKNVPEFVKNF